LSVVCSATLRVPAMFTSPSVPSVLSIVCPRTSRSPLTSRSLTSVSLRVE
jgi:hypothetical protein